jgi:hypothetical protein
LAWRTIYVFPTKNYFVHDGLNSFEFLRKQELNSCKRVGTIKLVSAFLYWGVAKKVCFSMTGHGVGVVAAKINGLSMEGMVPG